MVQKSANSAVGADRTMKVNCGQSDAWLTVAGWATWGHCLREGLCKALVATVSQMGMEYELKFTLDDYGWVSVKAYSYDSDDMYKGPVGTAVFDPKGVLKESIGNMSQVDTPACTA